MDFVEPLREVTIGESVYHVGRFSSKTGSWVLMRMMKAFRDLIKSLEDDGTEGSTDDGRGETQQFSESLLQTLLSELDADEYERVQKHALSVVTLLDYVGEKQFNQPIIRPSGMFAISKLNDDIAAVSTLTSQSIFANLWPFFTKTGLQAIMRGETPTSTR